MKSSKTIASTLITVLLITAVSSYAQETSPAESTNTDEVPTLIVIGTFLLFYLIFWLRRTKRLKTFVPGASSSHQIFPTGANVSSTKDHRKLAFDHLKKFNDEELEVFRQALSSTLQKNEPGSETHLSHQ